MPPDNGNVVESSLKQSAIKMIKMPPIIQLSIAAGPAIFAARKLPNNQPDPIMQLKLVQSNPNEPIVRFMCIIIQNICKTTHYNPFI